MANITVQVIGGAKRDMAARTVREAKDALGLNNYQANINGRPAEDAEPLSNNDFVTLSPAVKGGC